MAHKRGYPNFNETLIPSRISVAAAFTTSGVNKFRVPSSSFTPFLSHSPQVDPFGRPGKSRSSSKLGRLSSRLCSDWFAILDNFSRSYNTDKTSFIYIFSTIKVTFLITVQAGSREWSVNDIPRTILWMAMFEPHHFRIPSVFPLSAFQRTFWWNRENSDKIASVIAGSDLV
jgi:hypothetical protein